MRSVASLRSVLLLAGLIAAIAAPPAVAIDEPPPPRTAGATAVPSGSTAPGAPGLLESALDGVPPDDPRMEAYSHGGYALRLVDFLWGVALLSVIVFTGLGGYLQALVERVTRRPNLKVALYTGLFTVIAFVGGFPLSVYRGYVREKAFGFANQSFPAWLGDQGKELAVGVVLQALFFTVLYLAIRRLGRRWWIAGAGLAIAFLVLVLAVAPVFIAPLFNTFEPLKDAALRGDILAMAHAQGIPADEVYQVDASRQSEHNNAYVAGLLGTQRIVLYDTILRNFSPREVKVVMGHEMGHYVMNHIWKFVAFLSIVIAIGFFLVDRVSRRILERRPALGITALPEPASLPLLILVLNVYLFLSGPAIATFSRTMEHDADVFGIEATRDPVAAASAFLKFGRLDLGEYHVHPWIEALLFDHPSLGSRIRFAQDYARRHGTAAADPL
jgi:STE24 endopeptidase